MLDEKESLEKELNGYKQQVSTELGIELELERDLVFQARTPRGYELDFDAKVEWGCMPTESLLASIASCLAIDVVSILRKMRADISSFIMEVKAERNAKPPQYIKAVNIMIKLKGKNLSENKVKRAISLSKDKYCSVYHSLRKDLEHIVEYKIDSDD